MLDAVVEETSRAFGPLDTATMHRQITIVGLLAEAGRIDIARERLISLSKECESFPQGHFIITALKQTMQRLEDYKG